MELENFLVSEIFSFLLIFTRIGAGLMVIPGIGERYVAMRFRLLAALMISLAMTPALAVYIPPAPASPLTLTGWLIMEILVGVFIGLLARFLISMMHTVGMVISYQSSLGAATMFDINMAGQGSSIGNFLSLTALVLLFATNMHHLMLLGLFDSYTLFPPGLSVPIGDMTDYLARLTGDVFEMAIKLGSPLIIMALMIYLGSGLLSRLMPNMHVFFVIIPPQILLSFIVLMFVLSGMMLWYLDFVEAYLTGFLDRN